ncbi:MAG: D-alanyl-D-alanine carboxypeptidase [Alphaproteobacteria bacterium]|nr:D-alanyl-D-alanine carboxypeptidase [Alphaproteobacteria bacterium]
MAARFAWVLKSFSGFSTILLAIFVLAVSASEAAARRYAAILIDARSGEVLEETNADAITYPASLTKIMTLYMVFEALERGRLRLDQRFTVSKHAATQSPSKLDLRPGETISVHDLILGLVTKSANDAAAVVAEGMAGSEYEFARRMTKRARELGMSRTTFRNASGLPNPHQQTTARDMATLGRAVMRDFPKRYRYFATEEFVWRGQVHRNHNHLLGRYDGLDGIKTGFINASGFNLVASAERNGRRLIGVVLGGTTARGRDAQMASLLDDGFENIGRNGRPSTRVARAPKAMPAETAAATERSTLGFLIPAAEAATLPSQTASLSLQVIDEPTVIVSGTGTSLAPAARAAHGGLAQLPPDRLWGIQVGAFQHAESARLATEEGLRDLARLHASRDAALPAVDQVSGKKIFRARLFGMNEAQARQACNALTKIRKTCMVVAPAETLKLVARFN